MAREITVDSLIKTLKTFSEKGYGEAGIKVHEKTAIYDNRILGVNPDEYERKQNNRIILKITVG